MPHDDAIIRVTEFSRDHLISLLAESEASGYRFLRRLVDEWGARRQAILAPGEAQFGKQPPHELDQRPLLGVQ